MSFEDYVLDNFEEMETGELTREQVVEFVSRQERKGLTFCNEIFIAVPLKKGSKDNIVEILWNEYFVEDYKENWLEQHENLGWNDWKKLLKKEIVENGGDDFQIFRNHLIDCVLMEY